MNSARLYHVTLPMQTSFEHLAATRQMSDSVMLRLDVEDNIGLGECAPRVYVTGETSKSVSQSLLNLSMNKIIKFLHSKPANEILHELKTQGFEKTFNVLGTNNLICLLEITVLDWLGKKLQVSAEKLLAPNTQNKNRESILISQVLDTRLPVEEFIATRGPFHFIKIKGSLDHKKDIETVCILRRHIGETVPIMVDANMHWQFDDALIHIKKLRDAGVNFIEEPLVKNSWHQLCELRRRTGALIMLDESICSLQDAQIAIHGNSCDAFNIRVAKCGGLLNSIKIINFAREHGMIFQIGVQVAECGPLIHASRVLAINNPDALTVEGGQSDRFFQRMVVQPRPSIDRNLNVFLKPTGFGFGLDITEDIEPFEIYNFCQTDNQWQSSLL